jgi:hypothetical protein
MLLSLPQQVLIDEINASARLKDVIDMVREAQQGEEPDHLYIGIDIVLKASAETIPKRFPRDAETVDAILADVEVWEEEEVFVEVDVDTDSDDDDGDDDEQVNALV